MNRPTGERVSLESSQQSVEELLIYLLHERTYRHALDFVEGKSVLEFGCGDGYGTRLLAERAKHVVGIDVSLETVEAARIKYQAPNLCFAHVPDVARSSLPFADGAFDVIVSFQVVEHVADTDRYLAEASRLLKKDGILLLSTPNAASRLLPFQNPWNKFHLTEYTPEQLNTLLNRYFTDVHLSGLSFQQPWLDVEHRRANRNKWMLWPVTHKWIPDAVRQRLLHHIWNVSQRLRQTTQVAAGQTKPAIDDAIVTDDSDQAPSLLAICRKGKS